MTTTTNTTPVTAQAEFAAVMNPTGAAPVSVSNVFRPKIGQAKASVSASSGNVLTASVERAIGTAEKLAQDYQNLRVEVLDRSDRALWQMLQQVYGYVQQVDGSAQKRETRNELIRKIQQRDSQGVASNATTEAVAVRYVFADLSRQTRNNYTIAMEKARALDIPVTEFADFLAKNGGVGGVVETVFDHEAEEQATAKEMADAKAAEKAARMQLVTRLYSAMAHTAESELAYAGEVTDWVPKDPKSTGPTPAKANVKPDARYEKGNFVFFVTVHNPQTDRYHVVQGNVFDQAYEQQLLASIADRMDITLPDLSSAVQGLERVIGFGSSAVSNSEELQQA